MSRKALFFLLFFLPAVLVSCSPPSPQITSTKDGENTEELASESEFNNENTENWESSREYFQYQLNACTGEQAECMNNTIISKFIDIEVIDEKVHISRSWMDPSLNAKLIGSLDPSNGQLTDISGRFGIAQTEDWSRASGFLQFSDEKVTGSISGIQIEYEGSNEKCGGRVEISCAVSLTIGKTDD